MAHRTRDSGFGSSVREVVDSDEADAFEAALLEQYERMTPGEQAQWTGRTKAERLAGTRYTGSRGDEEEDE